MLARLVCQSAAFRNPEDSTTSDGLPVDVTGDPGSSVAALAELPGAPVAAPLPKPRACGIPHRAPCGNGGEGWIQRSSLEDSELAGTGDITGAEGLDQNEKRQRGGDARISRGCRGSFSTRRSNYRSMV